MGRSPRSEAVAMFGERWVPPLLENLQQRLLDQPVHDARDAELSDPALRLGDFDPFDRLRLVGSREQLRPNVWPVLTQVGLGVLDGHPIDARATLVAANAFPRSFEISLGRTPPPSVVLRQPGFRVLTSPRAVRSLGNLGPGLHPDLLGPRPARTGSSAA